MSHYEPYEQKYINPFYMCHGRVCRKRYNTTCRIGSDGEYQEVCTCCHTILKSWFKSDKNMGHIKPQPKPQNLKAVPRIAVAAHG